MKKLMIVSAALVAVSAQAGWGDLGKAAAKDATAVAVKSAFGGEKKETAKSDCKSEKVSAKDAEQSEMTKKEAIGKKQDEKAKAGAAADAQIPSFTSKKYDWENVDNSGFKTKYHTRIVSAGTIENRSKGYYQIQQFHNDNDVYGKVGFDSMEDLEYAVDQLDAYVVKAKKWQKIAIENGVDGMRKDDDKTKVTIDKNGNRVESFVFSTGKNNSGKIYGYFSVRGTDKNDLFKRGFYSIENDGTVDFWEKQVTAFRKAVELYKTGLEESRAHDEKIKNAANLFD